MGTMRRLIEVPLTVQAAKAAGVPSLQRSLYHHVPHAAGRMYSEALSLMRTEWAWCQCPLITVRL